MKLLRTLTLAVLCLCAAESVKAFQRDSIDYYFKEAENCLKKGDRKQALRLFELARNYSTPASGKQDEYQYTVLLDHIATLRCEFGDHDQAILIEDKVIDWRRQHRCDYGQVGAAVSKKAIFYNYKKDYDSAIKYGEEAAELFKKRYGEKDHSYCVNLSNLASFYYLRGASPQDFQKAVTLAEKALKHTDSNTPEYAYALNALVVYESKTENMARANELGQKALQKGRAIFGKRSRAYADILTNQAVRLANVKNFSQAIDYCLEAKTIYEADSTNLTSLSYARVLNSLGSFCKQAERFDLGIDALTRAKQVLKLNHKEGSQDYISCLSNLAALYRMKGNLEKADEIALQTQQLIDLTQDDGNYLTFGKSLSEQAWMYAANGDFKHAIEAEQRALNVFTENKDTLNMCASMSDLSSHYFNNGQQTKAINLCQESIDILQKAHAQTTIIGRAYHTLSLFNFHLGNNQRALELSRKAVSNYEEMGETNGSRYSKILGHLAMCYYLNDSLDMAINISQRSLDILQSSLGTEHPDLVVPYFNISNYYLAKNDKQKMREYFERALEMQSQFVRNNFSHLTTGGRELYWNTKSYVFKSAPVMASNSDGDNALVCDAYNSTLFTKGILLNSEIDFENFLMKTGQPVLLAKYEELENLHKRIDDFKHSSSYDPSEMERLQRHANSLERELMRECKEFGNFTSNLSITYEQVADSLDEDAAAIEFVDTPMDGGDRLYSALCLRHGWKYPRLIPLFALSRLTSQDYVGGNLYQALKTPAGINSIYNHPQVGHLVWFKIMEALGDDTRTIYFAPTGIFHQLGIEYMKYNLEQRINERYDIHRLSSTKSIAQAKSREPIRSAAVYGGLQYEVDPEEMAELHQQYTQPVENLLAMTGSDTQRALDLSNSIVIDSLSRAAIQLKYLPATLTEANDVAGMLRQAGIDTQLLTDKEGTEESFKALSGKGISLLHIATHGYFFTANDLNRSRTILRIVGLGDRDTADQDRSMESSVLFLSGSGTAMRGRNIPAGVENGVVTAKEISQLDFRGLDLVVLSACQTGKGELKEDGVYGLQRAFKKAGAHTLLMSLWNVSDAATQQMMSSFYAALAAGHSRHTSFAMAQQAVRDAGFSDPYYWASFILLDDNE